MEVVRQAEGVDTLLARFRSTTPKTVRPTGGADGGIATKWRVPYATVLYYDKVPITNPVGKVGDDMVPSPLLNSALLRRSI